MLTPFPDAKALSDRQKRQYNYVHSKTRIVVECTFGRLKSCFHFTGKVRAAISESSIQGNP